MEPQNPLASFEACSGGVARRCPIALQPENGFSGNGIIYRLRIDMTKPTTVDTAPAMRSHMARSVGEFRKTRETSDPKECVS